MGNTVSTPGFIYVAVFLSLLAFVTVAGCMVYMYREWKQLQYAKPVHGPSMPPYRMTLRQTGTGTPSGTKDTKVEVVDID